MTASAFDYIHTRYISKIDNRILPIGFSWCFISETNLFFWCNIVYFTIEVRLALTPEASDFINRILLLILSTSFCLICRSWCCLLVLYLYKYKFHLGPNMALHFNIITKFQMVIIWLLIESMSKAFHFFIVNNITINNSTFVYFKTAHFGCNGTMRWFYVFFKLKTFTATWDSKHSVTKSCKCSYSIPRHKNCLDLGWRLT